ncbi:hypothetical protein AQ505_01860 [Pedobacter sp. PACM 27299]|nr:hypothetical protein AQ505_01860 [Pedobacter sp. PACM 27299]
MHLKRKTGFVGKDIGSFALFQGKRFQALPIKLVFLFSFSTDHWLFETRQGKPQLLTCKSA